MIGCQIGSQFLPAGMTRQELAVFLRKMVSQTFAASAWKSSSASLQTT